MEHQVFSRLSQARDRAGEIVRDHGFGAFLRKLVISPTQNSIVQLLRYLVVGAVAAVADTGTLLFLAQAMSVNDIAAGSVGFIVGLIVNYAISINWVFQKTSNPYIEMALFAGIGAAGLVVNDFTLWAGQAWFSLDLFWAKMLAIVVAFFWNFIMRKILFDRLGETLRRRAEQKAQAEAAAAETSTVG